jgi:hypothetical protein
MDGMPSLPRTEGFVNRPTFSPGTSEVISKFHPSSTRPWSQPFLICSASVPSGVGFRMIRGRSSRVRCSWRLGGRLNGCGCGTQGRA